MTRADKLGLLTIAAIPVVGIPLALVVWLVRRARERNRVQVVRPPIEVVDLVAARERLARGEEDWP